MAIGKSGMRQLLPPNLKLVSGPGCPVCVTHEAEVETFLHLAQHENVILATFGDLMRVPGQNHSLAQARAQGARVIVVYSTLEALKLARLYPDREVVFLGVGFETTAPTVAMSIMQASKERIANYSVYSMHKLVPPAIEALLSQGEVKIDGFLCPGHVSTIIGTKPYEPAAQKYNKPCVITGFDIEDILQALIMLLTQIKEQRCEVQNQYVRGVNSQGNMSALGVLQEVFEVADASWRGFGTIYASGLKLRERYQEYDALSRFEVPHFDFGKSVNACSCGDILKGKMIPPECRLYKRACTPAKPRGPCMVSSEGACAAYYRFEEFGG